MVGVDANDGTFSISMVVVDVGLAKKLTGPTLIGSGNPRFDWKWGQTGDILQVPVQGQGWYPSPSSTPTPP